MVSESEKNKGIYFDKEGKALDPAFNHRELSWLDFNARVLAQAENKKVPLFERLNFLSIACKNLDEFIMVRVASLKDMETDMPNKKDISGRTATQALNEISEKIHRQVDAFYDCYKNKLKSKLSDLDIHLLHWQDLNEEEKSYVNFYFKKVIYPILTPMAVDPGRPFPLIQAKPINFALFLKPKKHEDLVKASNSKPLKAAYFQGDDVENFCSTTTNGLNVKDLQKSLNFGSERKKNGKKRRYKSHKDHLLYATLQVPPSLPRLITLPSNEAAIERYVFIEDVIEANLESLFTGYDIVAKGCYRIIRDADMVLDEEDTQDLLHEVEKSLRQREWGTVIHLELETTMDKRLKQTLIRAFGTKKEDVYELELPLDLSFISSLQKLSNKKTLPKLSYPSYKPAWPSMLDETAKTDIFQAIREKDSILFHPYESFDPVIDFVRQAAEDPAVLAIKQTLYRVSGNSPIIKSLAAAAQNGKQVLVLLELKARFDEENNIHWARKLEQAGCHVIYGLVGLKTHSKITLVVRQEEDGIRRYLHLGTGNYNDATARIYTDLGLFTSKESFCSDATEFFNIISGYAEPPTWNKLIMAPFDLRQTFVRLIDREIQHAKAGRPSRIRAKMNALVDEEIIRKLYEASQAGVVIELLVRGICCLKAQIKGLSENIYLKSIVGRYLEHARIYEFSNGGLREVYLSSADWMPRNLNRRVELLFPIEDEACRLRVFEILDLQLADTERSFIGLANGRYVSFEDFVKDSEHKTFLERFSKVLSDSFSSNLDVLENFSLVTDSETEDAQSSGLNEHLDCMLESQKLALDRAKALRNRIKNQMKETRLLEPSS